MRLLLGKLYGTKVFVDNMQSHYFPYMPQLTGDREKLSGTGRPPAGPRLLPGNMYVVSVYLTNRSMYSSAVAAGMTTASLKWTQETGSLVSERRPKTIVIG